MKKGPSAPDSEGNGRRFKQQDSYCTIDLTNSNDGASKSAKHIDEPVTRSSNPGQAIPSTGLHGPLGANIQHTSSDMMRGSASDGDDAADADYQEPEGPPKIGSKRKPAAQGGQGPKRPRKAQQNSQRNQQDRSNYEPLRFNAFVPPRSQGEGPSRDPGLDDFEELQDYCTNLERECNDLTADNEQLREKLRAEGKKNKDHAKNKTKQLTLGSLAIDSYETVTAKIEKHITAVRTWARKWSNPKPPSEHRSNFEVRGIHKSLCTDEGLGTEAGVVAVMQHPAGSTIIVEAILNNMISHEILMRPFFFLDKEYIPKCPVNLEGALEWLTSFTSKDSEARTATWRSMLAQTFDLNVVEIESAKPDSFEGRIYQARELHYSHLQDCLLNTAFDSLLKVVPKGQETTREKSLSNIFRQSVELSIYLWRQGFNITCLPNGRLLKTKFKADSADIVEHPTMLRISEDTSLYGRTPDFIVCPRILAYGNDRGERFDLSKPLQKACFWFVKESEGPRTGLGHVDSAQSQSNEEKHKAQHHAAEPIKKSASDPLNELHRDAVAAGSGTKATSDEVQLATAALDNHVPKSGNLATTQSPHDATSPSGELVKELRRAAAEDAEEQRATKAEEAEQPHRFTDKGNHVAESGAPTTNTELPKRVNYSECAMITDLSNILTLASHRKGSLEEETASRLHEIESIHTAKKDELRSKTVEGLIDLIKQSMKKVQKNTNIKQEDDDTIVSLPAPKRKLEEFDFVSDHSESTAATTGKDQPTTIDDGDCFFDIAGDGRVWERRGNGIERIDVKE